MKFNPVGNEPVTEYVTETLLNVPLLRVLATTESEYNSAARASIKVASVKPIVKIGLLELFEVLAVRTFKLTDEVIDVYPVPAEAVTM